jgi:hypothetical protein
MMTESKDGLLTIGACGTCGSREQHFESLVPFGRTQEVWRVVCKCGIASMRWSVTKNAAARMWNSFMAQHERKRRAPLPVKNLRARITRN